MNGPSLFLLALLLTFHPLLADAQTVWDGPTLSFSKAAFADPGDPANQDLLVPGTALTRGDLRGLYNAALEAEYAPGSPANTEWAFPTNNPGQTIAASNFAALTFQPWATAHVGNPPSTVGQPAVVHLIAEDIYFDLSFTSWDPGAGEGSPNGGAFSYMRTTPALPVPALPGALGALLGLLALALTSWLAVGSRKAA